MNVSELINYTSQLDDDTLLEPCYIWDYNNSGTRTYGEHPICGIVVLPDRVELHYAEPGVEDTITLQQLHDELAPVKDRPVVVVDYYLDILPNVEGISPFDESEPLGPENHISISVDDEV